VEEAALTIVRVVGTVEHDHVFAVSGEMDMSTVGDLRAVLTALPTHERVALDLAGVTFCDSSGLNALLVAHRHFTDGDGRFVLRSVPPRITRMLEMTRLAQVFLVDPN
jgi:anti-sigma B factor antagonist